MIVTAVRKRTPGAVRTMLPATIRFELVGSRFSKRTVPVALVSSTRLPVALNVLLTETGIDDLGRRDDASRRGSGWVAVVSATTVSGIGPTVSVRGVTAIVADGSSRYAPTPPTSTASARIAPPISQGVRIPPRPPGRVTRGRSPDPLGLRGFERRADRRSDGIARDGRRGRCRRAAAGAAPRAGTTSPSVPSDAGAAAAGPADRRRFGAAGPAPAGAVPPAAAAGSPATGASAAVVVRRPPRQRRLVLGDRREDRQAGRRGERPRRRIAGHDREPLVVRQRVARQQPEVDPRRRHARAVRQDDRDPRDSDARIRAAAEVISSSTSR